MVHSFQIFWQLLTQPRFLKWNIGYVNSIKSKDKTGGQGNTGFRQYCCVRRDTRFCQYCCVRDNSSLYQGTWSVNKPAIEQYCKIIITTVIPIISDGTRTWLIPIIQMKNNWSSLSSLSPQTDKVRFVKVRELFSSSKIKGTIPTVSRFDYSCKKTASFCLWQWPIIGLIKNRCSEKNNHPKYRRSTERFLIPIVSRLYNNEHLTIFITPYHPNCNRVWTMELVLTVH